MALAKPFPDRREALSQRDEKPRLKIDNGHPERTVAHLRDILARSGRLYDRGTPVRVVHDQTLGGFVAHELNADSLTLEAHLACQPYKVTDSGIDLIRQPETFNSDLFFGCVSAHGPSGSSVLKVLQNS